MRQDAQEAVEICLKCGNRVHCIVSCCNGEYGILVNRPAVSCNQNNQRELNRLYREALDDPKKLRAIAEALAPIITERGVVS